MSTEITDIARLRKVIDRIDPNELSRVGIFPLAGEADSDDELRQYIDEAREPAPVTAIPVRSADKDCDSGHPGAAGDERRAFEREFSHLSLETLLPDGVAAYKSPKTQGAWEGWQASAAHRREDQRDAERYRMLRDGIEGWYVGPDYEVDESGSVRGYHHYYGEHLDVVLDRIDRTTAPAHGEPGALEQGDTL